MQAQIRATNTPGFQDTYSSDFPASLGKKTQTQAKSKANPQHKILNNQNYTESLRDHGNSYQTGRLNSDMTIESLGSRNINQAPAADGCFSAEDHIRKHLHGRNLQQEIPRNERRDDVNEGAARRRLEEFSLEDLVLTKAGKFDGRSRETKEYLSLCESADVEPYKYYEENIHKQSVQNHYEQEEEIQNGGNQDALAKLRDFPLSSLKVTKDNTFDMRKSNSKEFLALCEDAGVDPMEYYFEYYNAEDNEPESLVQSISNYQPASYAAKSEKIREPVYQNHLHQREDVDEDKEAALAKLREFPLNELWLTKKNTLDMRKNNTKDYLLLCNSAEVDPMDYYFENCDNPCNNMISSESVRSNANSVMSKASTVSQKSAGSVDSNLTLTKESKLDKRFNSTRHFIKEKVAEAELTLSQFDTSQLKRKTNGELDKRYKVNKEYLELQEKTQESYWENIKFN